ncbi:hypothetical protein ACGH6R_02400 [Gilliamella sp. CG13]|uniref:hypothetical protein n=1 Tax=Gilliamella sp. CG13 TaxID=3351502 RepID=UPI003987A4EE
MRSKNEKNSRINHESGNGSFVVVRLCCVSGVRGVNNCCPVAGCQLSTQRVTTGCVSGGMGYAVTDE